VPSGAIQHQKSRITANGQGLLSDQFRRQVITESICPHRQTLSDASRNDKKKLAR
jgi:hypothetical protein